MIARLPTRGPSSTVEASIRAEQLRLLYDQAPLAVPVNLAVAALLLALVHGSLPLSSQWTWGICFAIVWVLRAGLYLWRARMPAALDHRWWLYLFATGAFLAGAVWGATSVWLFPVSVTGQFLVAVTVTGMVAGAATSMSCVPWVYVAYMLPAVLPLALRFAIADSSQGFIVIALALIYCGGTTLAARTNRRLLLESLRLQFEKIELARELELLATRDALTGLPNRLILAERLERALKRAQRAENDVAVAFVDCDRFKSVNDSYGHATGDQYLQHVANALQRAVRETDTVARLGGDEFIVLLEGCGDRVQLEFIVQRMRMHALQPLTIDAAAIAPQLSIGVACYPGDGADVDALIRHADRAMYRAKHDGGNVVRYYQDLPDSRAGEELG